MEFVDNEINRKLCISWIRTNYEIVIGSRIDQNQMFKEYLCSMNKLGLKFTLPIESQTECVR